MRMNISEFIVCEILGCGYADIDYLFGKMDENILSDVIKESKQMPDGLDCGSIWEHAIESALTKAFDYNVDYDDFDIYFNFIDSNIGFVGNVSKYEDFEKSCNEFANLTGYDIQYDEPINNSRKSIKSDFDEEGYWIDDETKPVKREDMHGKFEKPKAENRERLRPQIEDALDDLMARKKFGLDKEVYDETVEYVIDLFGEEYPPKDAKEAVQEWYADTKRFFPEMFGKGEKRRLASSLYLKKIRSSRMIKSGRR